MQYEEQERYDVVYDLLRLSKALEFAARQCDEVARLRKDRDYWKERYTECLNQSIRHGEEMIGNVLLAMIQKPRAAENA